MDANQLGDAERSGFNPYAVTSNQPPAPEPTVWQVPDTFPVEWLSK